MIVAVVTQKLCQLSIELSPDPPPCGVGVAMNVLKNADKFTEPLQLVCLGLYFSQHH